MRRSIGGALLDEDGVALGVRVTPSATTNYSINCTGIFWVANGYLSMLIVA
jgi:hypothetical protein